MLNYYFFLTFIAGWIGNDAVTPIIGEHDPYYRVFGRVSSIYFAFNYLLYYYHHLPLHVHTLVSVIYRSVLHLPGTKSSPCCCYSNDVYNGCCHPYFNCHCPPHPYGNICTKGKYEV